ncbi:hypothetical protein Afil01_66030 [Actinorhabdospora filicis]|uniref:Uncharacterized protein n=1 Tax=Actinorhabdospora filicis TaxID=1785913 RepID=A0A9W6SSR5_9ACTN|nr:hypothetical protein [Actinorhabdospora filicis]GLZ81796.1 hypothetical protein Afil01_66030 [Actinorhabdospora filicis]
MAKPEDERPDEWAEGDARNRKYRIAHEGPASFKQLGGNCYALGERVKGEAVASVQRLKEQLPGAGGAANDVGGMFGQVRVARTDLMPFLVKSLGQLEADASAAEQQLYGLLEKVMTVSDKYDDVEKNNKTTVAKALADLEVAAQQKPVKPA